MAFGFSENQHKANEFYIHTYLHKGGRDSIDKLESALFNATNKGIFKK